MPELSISFTGLGSCDKASVDVSMAWQDPYSLYGTSYDTGTTTISGSDAWILDGSSWGLPFGGDSFSEGGYASISYQINGGSPQYFLFNIGGLNPSKGVVDAFYNSLSPPTAPTPPWFWGNILTAENSGYQYYVGSCPVPDAINVNDCPYVAGNPDGIGISQVDGETSSQYVSDGVYWNFEGNMETGLDILNSKMSESETNWNTNYANSTYTDPTPYDAKNPYYPNCYFTVNGSEPFWHANWIQDYNGHSNQHWYLWWANGGWVFKYNTTELGHNYVPTVCYDASY